MSKDFEKEYNELLDSQIPDLWSKIEPQLHDKKAPAKNIRKFRPAPVIGSIVAACLVIGISIPAAINMRNLSSSKSSDAASFAPMAQEANGASVSYMDSAPSEEATINKEEYINSIKDSASSENLNASANEYNSDCAKSEIASSEYASVPYNISDDIFVTITPEIYSLINEDVIKLIPIFDDFEISDNFANEYATSVLNDEYYCFYHSYDDSGISHNNSEIGFIFAAKKEDFTYEEALKISGNVSF